MLGEWNGRQITQPAPSLSLVCCVEFSVCLKVFFGAFPKALASLCTCLKQFQRLDAQTVRLNELLFNAMTAILVRFPSLQGILFMPIFLSNCL